MTDLVAGSAAPLTRRAAREERERRARRRPSALLGSTALMALVVVAGASAVGGTYALLSAQATVAGATVTAANLGLAVNGAPSATLGDWSLSPSTPAVRAFTVTNTAPSGASSVVSPLRVSLGASITVTASSPITANTGAVITPVASADACVAGLGTRAALSGYTVADLGQLAPGETKTYCLELGLAANTPVAQSGSGTGFTVNLTSTQLAN